MVLSEMALGSHQVGLCADSVLMATAASFDLAVNPMVHENGDREKRTRLLLLLLLLLLLRQPGRASCLLL